MYALLPSSSKRVSYPFPIFNTEKREGSSFLGRLSATDQQIPKAGRSEKTSLEIFHLRHFVPTLFDNVCAVRHFSCLYCPPAPLKVPWEAEATSTYQHFTLTLIFFHAWAGKKAAVESYKVPSLTL